MSISKGNEINALVIGKSGNGKSEYILSFLDEEHRSRINASGECQTTRTSMVYEITKDEEELQIIATIHSENSFVKNRMQHTSKYLKECQIREIFENEYTFDNFEESVIYSDDFFNCNEFEKAEEIETLFKDKFNKENFDGYLKNPINDDIDVIDDIDDINDIEVNDDIESKIRLYFEKFYKSVYKICFEELEDKCNSSWKIKLSKDTNAKINISNLKTEDITKFLKAEDDDKSYSSLVKTINIKAKLNASYSNFLEKLNIDKIKLVDTYGLDHAGTGEGVLKARFSTLFYEEYPEIQSVFYIRALNAKNPTELNETMPLIAQAKSSIVSYLIFTNIDVVNKNSSNICQYQADKRFNKLSVSSIGEQLIKVMTKTLTDNRLKVLENTKMGYASLLNSQEYIDHNIDGLSKLFYAIVNKTHMGEKYINIDNIYKLSESVCLDANILNNKTFSYTYDADFIIYRQTAGRIRTNLSNKILGFNGGDCSSSMWTDLICDDINKFFSAINDLCVKDCYKCENGEERTLLEAFTQCSSKIQEIEYESSEEYIIENNVTDCIKGIVYQNRKNLVSIAGNTKTVLSNYGNILNYINSVYAFADANDDVSKYVQNILCETLTSVLIRHNAKCFADYLKKDENSKMTQNDIDSAYETFFTDFYSTATPDDKENFEMIVEDKLLIKSIN